MSELEQLQERVQRLERENAILIADMGLVTQCDVALEVERDRLLVLVAHNEGKATVKQFVEYCGRNWQADDAWEWYAQTVFQYATRGETLLKGGKE